VPPPHTRLGPRHSIAFADNTPSKLWKFRNEFRQHDARDSSYDQPPSSSRSLSFSTYFWPSELVLPVRRLARNGFEAWAEVIAHDYEGLVAKEEASLYEAEPTRRW
jgi:hypothetical protein